MSSTRTHERGAAMIMGLFFAILLTAVVFRTYGLAEVVLHRERLQDAADAAAFSAAVVQARGMNLLALINMIMAVVLSVLVGLRIAETLGFVAIGICGILAWPTGGASLAAIPPLTTVTQELHEAAEQVKEELPSVLDALHTAGKAVATMVPFAMNGRVIDLLTSQYATSTGKTLGVVVPAHRELPVEDGNPLVRCAHAAEVAGHVAMLPLDPVMPGRVRKRISDATAKLATAGSSWFCDAKGEPPDLDEDRDEDVHDLPTLPLQQRCDEALAAHPHPTLTEREEIEAVCNGASAEYLASLPDRKGAARVGEPLCPAACEESDSPRCPPRGFDDCDTDQLSRIEAIGRSTYGSDRVPGGADSPYAARLALARAQCAPDDDRDLRGYWWIEQEIVYQYRWVELDARTKRGEFRRVGEAMRREAFVRKDDHDRARPCSDDEGYAAHGDGPICESEPVCEVGQAVSYGGPCQRTPPHRGGVADIQERVRRVTQVLRCAAITPHQEREVVKFNLGKELASEQQDGQNTNPFRVLRGAWLGGSDYQLRAVVLGGAVPGLGRDVAEKLLADAGKSQHALPREQLEGWGRVALAQAEYYFDVGTFPDLDDPTDDRDVEEWLWQQGWVARLRPFRLDMSKADGPGKASEGAGSGLDDKLGDGLRKLEGDSDGGVVSDVLGFAGASR